MVLAEWPNGNGSAANLTNYPIGFEIPLYPSWLNTTAVDDLFGFGEKYGRRHPVFPKLPAAYNTVLNQTGWYIDSVYILAASPSSTYMLCSMRASLTPDCWTKYHARMSGGTMTTSCDPSDLTYGNASNFHNATNGVISTDWAEGVGAQWAQAVSLGDGITDGASSNARLLSQLIPTAQSLDPSLPSIAEALAVLSGSTLLQSSTDSPFIHFWNYSTTVSTLKQPQYQGFRALIQTRDYASGGTQRWQGIFYIVLFLTFATNVVCLVYFAIRHGLVTDFIEPQNLFSLSLNSPPSQALDGACGGGPEKEQLLMNWHIKLDHEREHFYIQNGQGPLPTQRKPPKTPDYEMGSSPVVHTYTKLSSRNSSLL